ncbi:MAG: hypothetical protein JW860_03290 [Sedimentisphaerales bacterium]|nr:hypothetical protein [Sedimentisphaerales bacterium]
MEKIGHEEDYYKRFYLAIILAVALAYIESAVVVYLREIFYPGGFTFPLANDPANAQWVRLMGVELGREAATLVVLLTSAWLIGKNFRLRLAYFLTLFAVWDIFYYIWLKVLIDWPAGLMDWDILFLIPTMWASSVLVPVLISLTMLAMAVGILHREKQGRPLHAGILEVFGYILLSMIVIVLFCIAGQHVTEDNYKDYFSPFCWLIFITCEIMAGGLYLRCWQKKTPTTNSL